MMNNFILKELLENLQAWFKNKEKIQEWLLLIILLYFILLKRKSLEKQFNRKN